MSTLRQVARPKYLSLQSAGESLTRRGQKGQIEMHAGKDKTLRVFLVDAGASGIKSHEWVDLPVPASVLPGGYAEHLDAFAASVQDGMPVPVDPQDALHTQACALAIYGEQSELPPGYEDPAKTQSA